MRKMFKRINQIKSEEEEEEEEEEEVNQQERNNEIFEYAQALIELLADLIMFFGQS
jgi:hypothetical protein